MKTGSEVSQGGQQLQDNCDGSTMRRVAAPVYLFHRRSPADCKGVTESERAPGGKEAVGEINDGRLV